MNYYYNVKNVLITAWDDIQEQNVRSALSTLHLNLKLLSVNLAVEKFKKELDSIVKTDCCKFKIDDNQNYYYTFTNDNPDEKDFYLVFHIIKQKSVINEVIFRGFTATETINLTKIVDTTLHVSVVPFDADKVAKDIAKNVKRVFGMEVLSYNINQGNFRVSVSFLRYDEGEDLEHKNPYNKPTILIV